MTVTAVESQAEFNARQAQGVAAQAARNVTAVDFADLHARFDLVWTSAEQLDESEGAPHRLALAQDGLRAVEKAYGDCSEDDGLTRLACYVLALEAAVDEAHSEYDLGIGPCMSWGSGTA